MKTDQIDGLARPRVRARRPTAAIAGLVAGCALISGAVIGGSANADAGWVPGQPATQLSPPEPSAAAAATKAADEVGRRLGLDLGVRRSVQRVLDRRGHRTYDEVTALDLRGRATSVVRLGVEGRVTAALRLGWATTVGAELPGGPPVVERAVAAAGAAGITPSGRVTVARGANDWIVSWQRVVADVPVPADGLTVRLLPDGTFHALALSEHPLAGRPARLIDPGTATAGATERLQAWFRERATSFRLAAPELAWTAPNDTFGPGQTVGPEAVLRLSWVVRATATGTLRDDLRELELDFDAGDGRLLGGDVVR